MIATKTLAVAALALVSGVTADTVTLYDSPFFEGEAFTMWIRPVDCFNVGPYFNDRASSSNWDLPHGRHAWIEFYEHNDCKGKKRPWSVDANGYPNHFGVDGIDNMVSSVRMRGDWDWCDNCYTSPIGRRSGAIANESAPTNTTQSSEEVGNATSEILG